MVGSKGLTDEQFDKRRLYAGASDAPFIWGGQWTKLYDQKVLGIKEDLSKDIIVQLGVQSEDWHRDVLLDEYETKHPGEEAILSEEYPFLGFLPDGWIKDKTDAWVPLELKMCQPWKSLEELAQKYWPQVQHQMIVSGSENCALSIAQVTGKHELFWIEADPEWQEEYIQKAADFWSHVATKNRPEDFDAPMPVPAFSTMRSISMEGNNAWANNAADFLEAYSAEKKLKKAKEEIKNLIEHDVKEASGHGIIAKKSKKGSVTIKPLETAA